MKRYYFIISVLMLVIAVSSCRKTWEDVPLERFTEEYVWDEQDSLGEKARAYLTEVYSNLPSGFNRIDGDFLCSASDDAITSATGNVGIRILSNGGLTSLNNPDDAWNISYSNIRKTTLFINNIDRVPLATKLTNGMALRPAWKAEARFIRALSYFELLKRYGGIPLMGDMVRDLDDDLDIPRSSFSDCVEYIVSECDLATDSLRPDPVDNANIGHASKGAAMALKARVLLYAASPLYNGGNIEAGNPLTGYDQYDANRWNRAAEAAKSVMDYNSFQLHPSFKELFLLPSSREVIFSKVNGQNTEIESNNGPIGYSSGVARGRTSPVQELVDAFPMANGLPITDPLSGYDPERPYNDRDPRLSATVFYNGSLWLGRPVQTYEGGLDKPGGTVQQTATGYYLRKFMGNFENQNGFANTPHFYYFFRYAEVLLNYAEALNEFSGPVQEVYDAVEAIRQRAGLSPYQLPAGLTKEEMRTAIRNERRLELSFEEHRYWDIRRWKIAEEVMNRPLHGVRIDLASSGAYLYQEIIVSQPKFFAPRMYFYPIRYDEVVKNDAMVQNPGWDQ